MIARIWHGWTNPTSRFDATSAHYQVRERRAA
jgi:hypothetical protein